MKIIFIVISVLFSNMCFAAWKPADEDLENCYWRDGHKMSEKNCTEFRAEVAKDAANQKSGNDMLERQRKAQAEREQQNAEKARLRAIENEEAQKRQQAETERILETNRRLDEESAREERASAKAARAREQAGKEKCGNDYKSLRIGMTLSRAQQCVGNFKLKSQLNRADGIISTYVNGYTYINVMDEKIVSWEKF